MVMGSEQFSRTNRERLPEKQKDTLSQASTTLKKDYDRIYNLSDDWLNEAVDRLNHLKEDEEARVSEDISAEGIIKEKELLLAGSH